MTCDEIRELIHEEHDDGRAGALPEPARAHIAACGACRTLTEELEALRDALRSLPPLPLPGDALDAVWSRTVAAKAGSSSTSRSTWRLAAAAVFMIVISATTLYFVFSPAPERRPTDVELARAPQHRSCR